MSGRVSIVGAGCAPGLITALGLERLGSCGAVLYDDLIDPGLLAAAPEGAERVYVGKRAGRPSAGQDGIIRLMAGYASRGLDVVRLKGGDPLIFGRGGEELMALNALGICCELIPGVTSAAAVPALCGIPLTHRGLSRGFAVVTAHTGDGSGLPDYFPGLADFPGTLCVLMGLGRLAEIAASLIAGGKDPATPCAVCAAGSAAARYCVRGTLADIAEKAAGLPAPAVIVIGPAAALDISPAKTLPLAARRVGLTGTRRMNAALGRALRELGAEPFTACETLLRPLDAAGELCEGADCLAFTSVYGVGLYFERLLASGRDARSLAGVKLAAVGRATAAALASRGLRADFVPDTQTTSGLADTLLRALPAGESVCLYRSAEGDEALAARLSERLEVRDIRAYEAVPGPYAADTERIARADCLAFTSAATASRALGRIGPLPAHIPLAAIGAPTAKALSGLPNPIITAPAPSAQSLAQAISAALG